VAQWEAEDTVPRSSRLKRLANALGASIDELLASCSGPQHSNHPLASSQRCRAGRLLLLSVTPRRVLSRATDVQRVALLSALAEPAGFEVARRRVLTPEERLARLEALVSTRLGDVGAALLKEAGK